MEESAGSPEETKEATEGEEEGKEKKEQQQEGEVQGEGEGGGDSQTSIFQSPLRLVRKTKMKLVVCHVTLLDGSDFTCEVEVRHIHAMQREYLLKFIFFLFLKCILVTAQHSSVTANCKSSFPTLPLHLARKGKQVLF